MSIGGTLATKQKRAGGALSSDCGHSHRLSPKFYSIAAI